MDPSAPLPICDQLYLNLVFVVLIFSPSIASLGVLKASKIMFLSFLGLFPLAFFLELG